jgi:uncharacterized protein
VSDEVPLRQRLRAALPTALKSRDRTAVSALRSTIAAIDNAEAVDGQGFSGSLAIEWSPVGVGAAELPRRVLHEADVEALVRKEIADREAAALEYDQAGRSDRADQLRAEVGVLAAFLAQ